MLASNNKRIMGDRTNNHWTNLAGWTATAVMLGAAIVLIFTWGKG